MNIITAILLGVFIGLLIVRYIVLPILLKDAKCVKDANCEDGEKDD